MKFIPKVAGLAVAAPSQAEGCASGSGGGWGGGGYCDFD